MTVDSIKAATAPTLFQNSEVETYAYRRFGSGKAGGVPLLCLQHFTGTLDNWDPALMDAIANRREVVLFDNAGIGRSTGSVPHSVNEMANHALAFVDAIGLTRVDILGFSLGGMVAQLLALERPSLIRKLILVGTAPEGGEEIMQLETPHFADIRSNAKYQGLQVLVGLFFTHSDAGQAAGRAFVERLMHRKEDREPITGKEVAAAQMAAFRKWEAFSGTRYARLKDIPHPTLVVNGSMDALIPVRNSYALAEHLPNAMLLTFPDAGHGSLFQYHQAFTRQLANFLDTDVLKF